MKQLFFIMLSLLLTACSDDDNLSIIRLESLLHDESSKMWMIESDFEDGEEFAPENRNFKTVLIFYKSGKFAEQPLNTLGNRPPKTGTFTVTNHEGAVVFSFGDDAKMFKIGNATKKQIILIGSNSKIRMIPLPEF